jgi:hypothetical protein
VHIVMRLTLGRSRICDNARDKLLRDWRPVLQMLDHNQLGASKFDDRLRPSSSRHRVRIAGFI